MRVSWRRVWLLVSLGLVAAFGTYGLDAASVTCALLWVFADLAATR